MSSRRQFVKTAAAASAMLALNQRDSALGMERPIEKADAPLKILVLGGTGFTGPHTVRYAMARGHQVTVFNRGMRTAELPKDVEYLRGDRNAPDGTAALKGPRTWDVVIDIPTTLPKWVRDAGEALKGRVGQYIFISTISTYAGFPKAWMDETSEVAKYAPTDDPFAIAPTAAGPFYGPLKVLSEREAEKYFPGKTTIIRPGLIVGPGDTSDRFTYWPVRIAKGGEVMVPGDGKDPAQIIDARDLSEWVVRMAENKTIGTFNATGPRSELTMGEMIAGIRAALPGSLDVKFTWVPQEFLAEQKVNGWSHMPVWVANRPGNEGWSRVSIARALEKGLTFRPLSDTTQATLDWYPGWFKSLAADRQARGMVAGVTAAREAEVLAAWKAKRG